jgi:hypothetical protein
MDDRPAEASAKVGVSPSTNPDKRWKKGDGRKIGIK